MLKLLKHHMRGAALMAVLAPLAMAGEVFMDILQPTYMSEIIDQGVARGDVAFIWARGLRMLAVALVGAAAGAGCTVFSTIASARFGATLRQALFDKIQTLSFREIDRITTSSLVTRLTNDVTQLQNMLMMGLRGMTRAPFSCVGGLVMAFALSPRMALIFVAALPALALAVVLIIRAAFPLFSQMQTRIDRVNTVMRENLLGVRVVKAFVAQEREEKRFGNANRDLMEWSLKAANLTILLGPIVQLITNLSIVALFWFGGRLAVAGGLETGKIMALMSYFTQVLASLMMVLMMLMNVSRALASAARVNEVLDTVPAVANDPRPLPPAGAAVEFDHVYFRYNPGAEHVLKDVTFTANPGETIGVIGATGSGKSTLVSLIPRLYDVESGAVRVGGVDVRRLSLADLRREVGMVFQDSVLFAGTVRENLAWADCSPEEMRKAVEDAQAAEFIDAHPAGLDAPVEQRGKNFSGGQKQRLSLARTLARRPRVLILDDATSAVDTATEARLRAAVSSRTESQVVFVIAQRVSAIRGADKIIVIDEGRITGIGTHDDLLRTNEIYRAITVSQLGEEAMEKHV